MVVGVEWDGDVGDVDVELCVGGDGYGNDVLDCGVVG